MSEQDRDNTRQTGAQTDRQAIMRLTHEGKRRNDAPVAPRGLTNRFDRL
ncbi:hypothetical protein [Sediminimonas sp.]|nr:hypothetical protein [Sediminimonas sp.]